MSYYQRGIIVGAAVTSPQRADGDWSITQYNMEARRLARMVETVAEPYTVVALWKNNEGAGLTSSYKTRDEANGAYDVLTDRPGKAVYVAVFDAQVMLEPETKPSGAPYDEAYFVATAEDHVHTEKDIQTLRRQERTGLGWILGGVGLGILTLGVMSKARRV